MSIHEEINHTRHDNTAQKKNRKKTVQGRLFVAWADFVSSRDGPLARGCGKGNEIRSCYKCSHIVAREAWQGNPKLNFVKILLNSTPWRMREDARRERERDRQTDRWLIYQTDALVPGFCAWNLSRTRTTLIGLGILENFYQFTLDRNFRTTHLD